MLTKAQKDQYTKAEAQVDAMVHSAKCRGGPSLPVTAADRRLATEVMLIVLDLETRLTTLEKLLQETSNDHKS